MSLSTVCNSGAYWINGQSLPTDSTTLKEELAKIKARNMERKAQREAVARSEALARQAEEEKQTTKRSWWPWCE